MQRLPKKTIIIGILIVTNLILLWFGYTTYKQQRWNANRAVAEMERLTYLTYEEINRMDEHKFNPPYLIHRHLFELWTQTNLLIAHFNSYEDTINKNLLLNDNYFENGLQTLKLRNQQNLWSSTDQKYYEQLVGYLKSYAEILKNEKEDLDHGNIFAIFDINRASKTVTDINKLNFAYVSGHKASELNRMSESKIKQKIARQLEVNQNDIEISKPSTVYGWERFYRFNVDNPTHYEGEASPFTGNIVRITQTAFNKNGSSLTKEEAQQKAAQFLNRMFAGDYNYKMIYKGINHNHTFSGTDHPPQLFSFLITPLNNNYPYLQPWSQEFSFYINKNTGAIDTFRMAGIGNKTNVFFSRDFFEKDFTQNITIDEARELLQSFKDQKLIDKDKDIKNYRYQETGIIYSQLTGSYELVHQFGGEQKHQKIFINAENGRLEKAYFDMD